MAGAAVQWLRDGLGLIRDAAESGVLAAQADPAARVYLVPAFVGLGAPHWEPDVRGALFGLTRDTGRKEIACAALESVCYQTHDLLDAMGADWPGAETGAILRADGGMAASCWTMQRLADLLGIPVDRPVIRETTALGAAYLAGWTIGLYPDPVEFAESWRLERRFTRPCRGRTPRASRRLAGGSARSAPSLIDRSPGASCSGASGSVSIGCADRPYLAPSSSTSKIKVALGGITPPARARRSPGRPG